MRILKDIRKEKKLTQREAAERLGISLRSYISYENDENKINTAKYSFLVHELERMELINEDHGVLTLDEIRNICETVFSDYHIDFCYLFGSYAKAKATDTSDIDLLIRSDETGLVYYEIVERLREKLKKKIDLLEFRQLKENEDLLKEVMKDGIKIYG